MLLSSISCRNHETCRHDRTTIIGICAIVVAMVLVAVVLVVVAAAAVVVVVVVVVAVAVVAAVVFVVPGHPRFGYLPDECIIVPESLVFGMSLPLLLITWVRTINIGG